MHDEGFDAAAPQPSGQPKPVTPSLESENDPFDRATGLSRSIAPTLRQMQ